MNAQNSISTYLAALVLITLAELLIVSGCALDKNGNGPGVISTRIGGHSGLAVEPKRCLLKVAIVARPFGDPVINDVVWRVADEQVIPPTQRRTWEVNGLRIGRISGDLPLELEAAMSEKAPQKRVNPTNFFVDNGEPALVIVGPPVEQASLLLNRDNRIFGKDFRDASSFFRVTPEQDGINDVSLRLVPEIHHGPVQRNFQAVPTASPIGPQEFLINNGQQEETIRDLAITLVLAPGQVAVIGYHPQFKRSLGSFMLTEAVAHNDHRLEKLILIWASRNFQGKDNAESASKTSKRSDLFKRLDALSPASIATRPDPPSPEMPSLDSDMANITSGAANGSSAKAPKVPNVGSSKSQPSQNAIKSTNKTTDPPTTTKNTSSSPQ